MMFNRKLFLVVSAAACGLVPVHDCLAQKVAKTDPFVLAVQNYAAIDLSGSSTGSNPVDQIALADNNNAAFSFWNGTNYMVGKCVNGTLVEPPKQTGSIATGHFRSQPITMTLNADYARVINTHGDVGTFGGLSDPYYNPGNDGPLGAVIWPYGAMTTVAQQPGDPDVVAGDYYQYPRKQGVVSLNDSGALCCLLWLAGESAMWSRGSGQSSAVFTASTGGGCGRCQMPPAVASDVLPVGSGMVYFGWTGSLSGDCLLNFHVYNSDNSTRSYLTYIVGAGGSWTKLPLPDGERYPTAFNDSHDALVYLGNDPVTYLPRDPYLFDKDGNTLTFKSDGTHPGLIPQQAQPHLRNISPFEMSNRVAPPTDGSVAPVLHILFNAQIHRHPDSNTWDTSTFLLRLLSDGTTDLQELVYPDGVTNLQLKSINTSGVIAAIGNGGHALLLVPVSLSCDKADTTVPPDSNPTYFNKPNPPDPTLSGSKEPALIVFYKDVLDPSWSVKPFTVNLSFSNLGGTIWSEVAGPNLVGTLQNQNSPEAQFINPNAGGLFQFDGTEAATRIRTSLILPLAGSEIKDVVAADMLKADVFAASVISKYNKLERNWIGNNKRWFWDNGAGDYLGRPSNANSRTCVRFNPVSDSTGMGAVATWFGIPIRIAKASNFLVGYASSKIGVWESAGSFSQTFGTKNDIAAQASYFLGWDIAARKKSYSDDTLTMLRSVFSSLDIKDRRLWPNKVAPDNHATGTNVSDYNAQFSSPGFIYMTSP